MEFFFHYLQEAVCRLYSEHSKTRGLTTIIEVDVEYGAVTVKCGSML
jgi:hypothetical protein